VLAQPSYSPLKAKQRSCDDTEKVISDREDAN
jgi:hypothetical protein